MIGVNEMILNKAEVERAFRLYLQREFLFSNIQVLKVVYMKNKRLKIVFDSSPPKKVLPAAVNTSRAPEAA